MNLRQLQNLIKEEVEAVLDEVEKAKKAKVPHSFGEFRKMMGRALAKAGAHQEFVAEVEDLDNEGGGVSEALWRQWHNLELEIKDFKLEKNPEHELELAWPDLVGYYVHDAVIDAVDAFMDRMNYSPSVRRYPLDAPKLAAAVVADLSK